MNKTLALVAMAAAAVLPYSASALSYNANTDGQTPPAGVTFTTSGQALQTKSQAGWTVLGLNGSTPGEISLGEWLQINLSTPGVFNTLTLGLLFDGPEYNDKYEIAAATANGTVTYQLKATSETSATWSGPGSVSNLSKADGINAAVWEISNPFGSLVVSDIKLFPISSNPNGNESDFGLQAFSVVPDGGSTLALAGLGMVALGLFSRKLA